MLKVNQNNYIRVLRILTVVVIVFSFLTTASAQENKEKLNLLKRGKVKVEIPVDEYRVVDKSKQLRTPAYSYSDPTIFTTQVNVDNNNMNIVGDAANEPSLAYNINYPNKMAIGWRQFDVISNNFRQAGYAYSIDTGKTWTFPGVIEPGIFRSDPVLDSDAEGNFYYNSLSKPTSDYSCDIFKSTDGGATWGDKTYAYGGDKQWMIIDKTESIGRGNFYSNWKQYFSVCQPGFFIRSSNFQNGFESCIPIPDEPQRGTIAMGPEGELYSGGQVGGGFAVARSTNAKDSSSSITWDFSKAVNLDGSISSYEGPNPGGLLGQPWVAADHSTNFTRGNVYLLCSVNRTDDPNSVDVMFARSTNGGENWDAPIAINSNELSGAYHWMNTMSVSPNGRIDVIWVDNSGDITSMISALKYSCSFDGGETWTPNKRLSDNFDPHLGWPQQQKMGDYYHMVSDSLGAHLAWSATFNGEQDVYYSYITAPILVSVNDDDNSNNIIDGYSLKQNYPNPFNPTTKISYSIPRTGTNSNSSVRLIVYDFLGKEVATLVNEKKPAGNHEVVFDISSVSRRIASGVYFYELRINDFVSTKKMVLMK